MMQLKDNVLDMHISRILNIVRGRYHMTPYVLVRMANHSLNNSIVDIFTKKDFDDYLKRYQEMNTECIYGGSGDFFADFPTFKASPVSGYVCVSIR